MRSKLAERILNLVENAPEHGERLRIKGSADGRHPSSSLMSLLLNGNFD
jgi:hypothetical protein